MTKSLLPAEGIERSILLIRQQKVLLDANLADIYSVETKELVRAVKRNPERFRLTSCPPTPIWPANWLSSSRNMTNTSVSCLKRSVS